MPSAADPQNSSTASAAYEKYALVLSVLAVGVCMVLPLFLISAWDAATPGTLQHAGEVTVGIGVILRATLRRIFRAAARGILRTTLSTVSRASTRTASRRMLRVIMKVLFGLVTSRDATEADSASPEHKPDSPRLVSLYAIGISFVVLCLSFWGVLAVAPGSEAVTSQRGLSVGVACLLAGVPILVYAAATYWLAALFGVQVRFAAEIDAILLQAYFTGAGSFLPMTTDVEYTGTKQQNARVAFGTIAIIYGCHLLLLLAASLTGLYVVEFTASMFLIYAFVYVFPIAPLEGHDVWVHRKLLWLILFVPILLSFFVSFTETLTVLL